jgi:hypothetical protein
MPPMLLNPNKCLLTLKYEVFGKFSVIAVIREANTKSAVKAPINLYAVLNDVIY